MEREQLVSNLLQIGPTNAVKSVVDSINGDGIKLNPDDRLIQSFLGEMTVEQMTAIEAFGRKVATQTLYNILLAADGRLRISDAPDDQLVLGVVSSEVQNGLEYSREADFSEIMKSLLDVS